MLITASIGGLGSDDNNFLNFCVAFNWSSSLMLYKCLSSYSFILDQSVTALGITTYKHMYLKILVLHLYYVNVIKNSIQNKGKWLFYLIKPLIYI